MNVSPMEILLVLGLILLLFGASRLPRLARSLREARDELKGAARPVDDRGAG